MSTEAENFAQPATPHQVVYNTIEKVILEEPAEIQQEAAMPPSAEPRFDSQEELLVAIATKGGVALADATDELKNDKVSVLEAVKWHPTSLRDAGQGDNFSVFFFPLSYVQCTKLYCVAYGAFFDLCIDCMRPASFSFPPRTLQSDTTALRADREVVSKV